jgi:hypothetical protein
MRKSLSNNLRTLSTDTAGKLNILRHDGHTLGVNGAEVGVFEQANKVCLRSFLQSQNSRALETKIGLEVLSDLTNKALEWQLADEELSALLVTTDLAKSDRSGAVTVRLLHTSGSRCALASSFGCKLLARSLASCGFTCGLLGAGHGDWERVEKQLWDTAHFGFFFFELGGIFGGRFLNRDWPKLADFSILCLSR